MNKENISICIDRITISGNMYSNLASKEIKKHGWVEYTDNEGNILKFVLFNENHQPIAYLLRNEHQSNSWRIDTSNHICTQESIQIMNTVSCLDNAHITRLDIAIDFINCPYAGMKHRLYLNNISKRTYSYTSTDKKKHIETIYYGSKKI